MSFIRINALQIGDEDWSKERELPYYVTWTYVSDLRIDNLHDLLDEIDTPYDVVFIDKNVGDNALGLLERYIRPYTLFVTNLVQKSHVLSDVINRKRGKVISHKELYYILDNELEYFFADSRGEKMDLTTIGITYGFEGKIKWNAGCSVELEGNYGKEYSQIAFWRKNIPVINNQTIDLWLEYIKDEEVDIELHVDLIVSGTVDTLYKSYVFTEEDMDSIVSIKNDNNNVNVFLSLFAKGQGNLRIVALHNRRSRGYHGHFLPGGQRMVTKRREEVFYYFSPGDLKPPLNVYFSRYKHAEGFEGQRMMDKFGCPYLLITDVRLEGGAFYLGDEEYEEMIMDIIKKHMYLLGFTSDQIIFSGLSMGAFAAMYYACDIKPHTVIVGKPILNIGDVAMNETINRPGIFPTSLDVLRFLEGADEDSARRANERFWERFDKVKWDETSFIIMHMYEDDYDNQAYTGLLSHIDSDRACVYGIGLHGRHNDNTKGIVSWFKQQYRETLSSEFGRSLDDGMV